ncbi:hypothetical protein [Nocardioides sp. L-11A]|uniref:hypothetical protein n=1 Tax=Nocardioides sp. L-11A TaxID=3043848 RepID=UPI00249AE49D|nr:hypothetical protein QJ852_14570 [Nocardioides sp. L-11A]
MYLTNHDAVLEAIEGCREVRVTWPSQEDGGAVQIRRCAPMDYGPSRRASDQTPRYHFWDFESDSGRNHTLSLLAAQIMSVEVLESMFDPSSFVTWDTNQSRWFVQRNSWGEKN